MITKQFFLDPGSDMVAGETVDKTAQRMRGGMTKVKTAYHEAKYEISYTYIRPYGFGSIQKSLDRLTKHLNILGGSLKTERILFENAIEVIESEKEKNAPAVHPTCPLDTIDSDSSDHEEAPRKSALRWIDSEDEFSLRKAALIAARDQRSPHNSRPSSRAGSRRNSYEDDVAEQNQRSISSLRSFLNMTKLAGGANHEKKEKEHHHSHHHHHPKPPSKANRQIETGDGELLLTYIESLRDPLMNLSVECVAALDCVSHSVALQLDVEDDDVKSIRKTWAAYLGHLLKLTSKPKPDVTQHARRHEPDQCDCAKKMDEAIRQFDTSEQERMLTLYRSNHSKTGNKTLDLNMREELFLVFFFIFTLREAATELKGMAESMDGLRATRRSRRHLYMPQLTQKWWRKWVHTNNHQSIRDKGGYTLGTWNQPFYPRVSIHLLIILSEPNARDAQRGQKR